MNKIVSDASTLNQDSALISQFNRCPRIGAAIPTGLSAFEDFIQLKLGNIILITLPEDKAEARQIMAACREHQVYVLLSELIRRGADAPRWHNHGFTKEDFEEIFAAAGEYFLGRYAIGELGGLLYWPREYLLHPTESLPEALPCCDNEAEAHHAYIKLLRERLEYERREVAGGRLFNVESSIVFPYHVEAGIDGLCLELLPGDPLITLASIRGAARAWQKIWGVHLAIKYYNGIDLDSLWMKRWRFGLYLSFLQGAHFIFPESGHYAYVGSATKHDFHDPKVQEIRHELRKVVQFGRVHQRQGDGPVTPVGVIHGKYDGQPGIWNPYAWGQITNGPEWESGDAEKGWFILRQLRRRRDCFRIDGMGDYDDSGNPAAGQYDLVPADADNFSQYRALTMVGFNYMTEELYDKLVAYVKQGGHLLLWLSHFNVTQKRGAEMALFRDGDLSELCGIRVVGRRKKSVRGVQFIAQPANNAFKLPVLKLDADPIYLGRHQPAEVEYTDAAVRVLCGYSAEDNDNNLQSYQSQPAVIERQLGEGFVWLVTDFEAPGAVGMCSLTENLLRVLMAGERGDIDVLAPDTLRWSRYVGEAFDTLYLLNTEFDLSVNVRVGIDNRYTPEITIPAAEMQIAYRVGDLVVCPENKLCNLEKVCGSVLQLATLPQKVRVANLADQEMQCTLNGCSFVVPAGGECWVNCPEWLPQQANRQDFLPQFLEEPHLTIENTRLSY